MKHVIVDLEMNSISQQLEAKRICTRETIEIGAVMLDDDLQEISTFCTYVKPEYSDGILPRISGLTGITDAMVAAAPKFNEALRMFTSWCTESGDEVTVYAWSDADFNQISKEIALKEYKITEAEERLLKNRWTDFQNEFDKRLGFVRKLSLNAALDMAGVDFSGREHDALDDARSVAELLRIVSDEERLDRING